MALTGRAQLVYDLLNGKPGITRIEGQSVRDIAGSGGKPSEHSYGNALDVYGTTDALLFWAAEMDRNRGKYNVKVICYDPGIGRKYDTCTTKHVDHLHLDFGPHCGGTIPQTGSPDQLVRDCNAYQTGQAGAVTGDTGGGLLGGIVQPLTDVLGKGFVIIIGVAIGIAGVVLLAKDTAIGQTLTGAVKTVATKGMAK